jgi:beta-galactosidase
VLGTENVSAVGTRGIYVTDPAKGYVGSYDPYTTTGRASARGWWQFVSARPWVAGGFVWTGFDYRGEPSPYAWPNISSQYGVIDLCGFPKDSFFYYRSWWTNEPVLHIFPHWNWPGLEGKEIAVWVYSNMDKVELFHNGQSLGAKEMSRDGHLAWNVKYAPGVIEARGYKNGRQVLTAARPTAGAPAKLSLQVDRTELRADGEDVAVVTVQVLDAQGNVVPITDNLVTFDVTGSAKLIGVGNGDPTSHESDVGNSRRAFSGLCMAIVQSTKSAGAVKVQATSPGLASAEAAITTQAATLRPQLSAWERPVPSGSGVTGLWRPNGEMIFVLHQNGARITGEVEAVSTGSIFGGSPGGIIEDGRIEGSRISFRAGTTTYTGTVHADTIELERSTPPRRRPAAAPTDTAPRPAIGPPPDGTDPSFGPGFGRPDPQPPLILRRAPR